MNRNGTMIGMDIGGTLTKLAVFLPNDQASVIDNVERYSNVFKVGFGSREKELEIVVEKYHGSIHFIRFLSSKADDAIALLHKLLSHGIHYPVSLNDFQNSYLKKITRKENKQRSKKNSLGSGAASIAPAIAHPTNYVCVTGGGAFKHDEMLQKELATSTIQLSKVDEMHSLYLGLRFVLKNRSHDECFKLKSVRFAGMKGAEREKIEIEHLSGRKIESEGFLMANVGSGVSFLQVFAEKDEFVRLGGSSLGGATFLGLTALLTGVDNFDEAVDLASLGDSTNIDMLVKDIYGGFNSVLGKDGKPLLRPSALAASFGKMIHSENRKAAKKEDICLAVLMMISLNVAAIAVLHARAIKSKYVLFSGSFLATSGNSEVLSTSSSGLENHSESETVSENSGSNGISSSPAQLDISSTLYLHKRNTLAMRTLSYAIDFWSQGATTAVFLKREGFLGALGALSSVLNQSPSKL